ncbi:MAG: type I-E CRISPR-associated protein Cas6/Cse3/CasE [Cutibacterium avidum]|nr:type I-E CRISPR-associated protein Cas6/Cse3/CasE [Cutibacterium avidum]
MRFRRRGSMVTLAVTQVDGVIHVADADAARGALTCGIGPAKGYGCGLMTLAPVVS